MSIVDGPREAQFTNPYATGARVIGWLLIGCVAWVALSVFIGLKLGEAHVKGVLAVVMFAGIPIACLAFGLVVGLILVGSNAKRTE